MKVVHLVTEDLSGAGRAAKRISKALCAIGVDSKVLVLDKMSDDDNVSEIWTNRAQKIIFKIFRKLSRKLFRPIYDETVFYESSLGAPFMRNKDVMAADVIHLHWVNYGFVSLKQIEKLQKKKRVVWTLHDMWPFTAGCYYDEECGGYRLGCVCCKKKVGVSSRFVGRQAAKKGAMYRKMKLAMVGCSHWITDCARASRLTQGVAFFTVPNPIDAAIFAPIDRAEERARAGLDLHKNIILFGASSSDSDKRKGYEYLIRAIELLEKDRYQVLIFGNGDSYRIPNIGLDVKALGRISDDARLAEVYGMADLFVAPSLQENLSNAVMEALSCGTPVVAFRIGGMPDLISHKETGYLAEPFDVNDLANGMRWCAQNGDLREACRESVLEKFGQKKVAAMYRKIYDSLSEDK